MTTYTNQVSITAAEGWTQIGTAPCSIELLSPGAVIQIIASDTQPTGGALGWVLTGTSLGILNTVNITESTNVWALMVNGPSAATMAVMNQSAAAGGSSVELSSAFAPTANTGAGSVASANTDQVVLAANSNRRMAMFQNTHATATIYLNFGAAAYSGAALVGAELAPGQGILLDIAVPNSALHAASSTTGATFFILEG